MACVAINGTVGLLEAIYKNAPTVKRVVITSSSAAILDQSQPTKVYSEASTSTLVFALVLSS